MSSVSRYVRGQRHTNASASSQGVQKLDSGVTTISDSVEWRIRRLQQKKCMGSALLNTDLYVLYSWLF